MTASTALAVPEDTDQTDTVVELEMLRFLYGANDGSALFHALYGGVIDEPIPAEMLALVRGACREPVSETAS